MFPMLKTMGKVIEGEKSFSQLWNEPIFAEFNNLNILPLIYNEKNIHRYNIIFNL